MVNEERPYEKKLALFRERFPVLGQPDKITTERTLLLETPDLQTDVSHLWEEPPSVIPNPCSEEEIGSYRGWEKRKCLTADMEVIEAYHEVLQKTPPSFREAGPRKYLHFNPKTTKVAIVTAGGVAPGLNTVIHSIVCRHEFYGTADIRGFCDGFRGFLERNWVPLNSKVTRPWIHKGGTGLRTLRERNLLDMGKVVDTLQEDGIDILYVAGGNGSLAGARELWKEISKRGSNIAVAGIPKTMDNDILWVWKSFGFDTAVAQATATINALHQEAESNNRICVVSLFGAKSGFVAANAALASGEVDAVLIPEENPISLERVTAHLEPLIKENHHAMLVAAEGIDVALNDLIKALGNRFGHIMPSRYEVFPNEPRHSIRAVPASPPEQIYCRRLSDLAVDNALAGFTDFVISWWLTEYVLVPLDLAIMERKRVPTGSILWKEVRNSTKQPSFKK